MLWRRGKPNGYSRKDRDSSQSRVDSNSAFSLALHVLYVFGLFAILWTFGAGFIIDQIAGRDLSYNYRNAAEYFGFVTVAGILMFIVVCSITKELVAAKRKLRESERELVSRLGQAAEWRDDETGDHTLRVGEYCGTIATSYGWTSTNSESLRVAAMLHDIGKIGIPDFVMVKTGGLLPEERELVQAHTLMGSDILAESDVPLIQMAQRVAASHHEWWDGSGYPYGLKGSAIPIEGRIAAVADVLDALTSKRRYKEAWAFDDALNEIRELSGVQFDPEVIAAFECAIPHIKSIYDKYQSTSRMFNISRAA